ncbi:MAG: hypothetical protein IIA62_00525 [Nitrospinae bacterium]|nr:hypothetical protein [Nitrospinota bacterium]
MKPPISKLLPLGDFSASDHWQTHVNEIFYGIKGPDIHNHFQTYVSLDHRLAHALAEEYYELALKDRSSSETIIVQEWGVGNGNLAACFLAHLKDLDGENRVYPKTRYILCDYSQEILEGVRENPGIRVHADRISTVRVDAEHMDCFKPQSVYKIISNEIWDDLTTKALLKHQGSFYEEYLQPTLDPEITGIEFEEFLRRFNDKDLDGLKECSPFLSEIIWERDFQRVDISDWPYADVLQTHLEQVSDEIPVPINIGAFAALEQAHRLLVKNSQGYCGFDYGMLTTKELNTAGRPYFKLYGGQYTCMVNFPLLEEVGKTIGFKSIEREHQRRFMGRKVGETVVSVVELVQNHPEIQRMRPWDVDLLMLNTLHALNTSYKSPYKHKMEYPPMPGTPKKHRKQIQQRVQSLSPSGVPDTVAYVTAKEVYSAAKPLRQLGYREKDLKRGFSNYDQPISFVRMNFK